MWIEIRKPSYQSPNKQTKENKAFYNAHVLIPTSVFIQCFPGCFKFICGWLWAPLFGGFSLVGWGLSCATLAACGEKSLSPLVTVPAITIGASSGLKLVERRNILL